MDIRNLRYFATIAELRSFTKAAAFLHIAQPALSRQVKQLEEELGLQLLIRAGRQVLLTDAGQALLKHARTIQRDFERLVEDMQVRKQKPSGRVVFGIPPTLANIVVPRVVRRISTEFPLIAMTIAEGITPVLVDRVRNNEVDLALLSASSRAFDGGRGLRAERLADEDMAYFERSSAQAVAPIISLEELRLKQLALSDWFAGIVQRQLEEPNLMLNVVLQIDAVQALKAMVLSGEAASILPISVFNQELKEGTVVARKLTARGVCRQLSLVQPDFRQMTLAADTVVRVIREEITSMANDGIFTLGPPAARPSADASRTRTRGPAAVARQQPTRSSKPPPAAAPQPATQDGI